MVKISKKTIGVFFALIVLMFASPIMQALDFDLPCCLENIFETKVQASSGQFAMNSSYDSVSGNIDVASLPSGRDKFYYGDTVYLNIQVSPDVYIHDAYIYLYKDGSRYKTVHYKDIFSYNYFKYWGQPFSNMDVGEYYFYYNFTYSFGSYSSNTQSYTTGTSSFSVVDRTPSLNCSSTSVSLNLAGTTSTSVNVSLSCDVSYSYYLQFDLNGATAFGASWGDWNNDIIPIRISANSVCSSLPLTIRLYRKSDNALITSRNIYVTITAPTYTVSYNANGGSSAPSSQTKQYNQSLTLSSSYPTRFGYNFLGWSKSSTATSASYLPGSSYTSNSSATLYAVWKQTTLSSNSSNTTTLSYGGQHYYYKFSPSSSGKYVIYSSSSKDTRVYLYDQSGTKLAEDDDSGDERNFRLIYNFTSGKTYYYDVHNYSSSETASIPFNFGPVYTISYNANGGSGAPSSQEKDYGKSISLSSTIPTRSGYTFLGWSTNSSATTASYSSGETYSTNASKYFYAVWSDSTDPTGSISSTNAVATSQTVTLSMSDNVAVAGYYWGTSSSYSSNSYTSISQTTSTTVTKTVSNPGTYYFWVKDTSGNISSRCSITFYKTTFDANGGNVSPSYVITKSGNSFTRPTPTRSGYTFNGWSTSSSSTSGSTGSYTPSASATLYATWAYVDSSDPTGSISSTNAVATSQTVTLSMSDNVAVAGYYWGTSSSYSSNSYTSISQTTSTTVTKTISNPGTYYFWVKDTSGNISSRCSITFYKTTFDANGGNVSPSYVITKSGNSFTRPTPTRSGYTFNGWSTSSSSSSGSTGSYTPSASATLYATWAYVDSSDPTGSISSTNAVATSQTVTLSMSDNVAVAGYYWGTSSSYSSNSYTSISQTTSTTVTKTISNPGTYYFWVKDTSGNISSRCSITFYKTTFDANGGNVSPSYVITKSGNSFTRPTPTRSGYTFNGWSTSSSSSSGSTGSYTPNSNSTFYSVWYKSLISETLETATITYGGEIKYYEFTPSISGKYVIYSTSSYDTEVYLYNKSGTQIAYNDQGGEGYNFRLAYKLSAGIKYVFGVRFYGKSKTGDIPFRFGPVYSVTYNANGGSGAPSSQEKDYGKSISLSSTIPTRSGYRFLGWSMNSEATAASYSAGSTYTQDTSRTLYAVWHKHSYTSIVTTNPTCTSKGIKTYTCTCGDSYTQSISAKGHKEVEVKGKASTCTSTGLTNGKKCSVCDTVTLAQKTIAKKAHTYKTASTTKATMSKDGSLTQKCSVCSATKKTAIAKIKSVSLSSKSYEYDSKEKTPSVTVKDSKGKTLKKDKDYTVKYASGRKNIGKYTVTVTFKGKYSGKKSLTFEIKLGKVQNFRKIKVSGYALAFEWDDVKGATGYQIQRYDAKKKKWVNMGNSTKTRIRIKSIKGTYKWRVRAFRKSDDKTYYGSWSSVIQTKS